jgi:hypothetical protein
MKIMHGCIRARVMFVWGGHIVDWKSQPSGARSRTALWYVSIAFWIAVVSIVALQSLTFASNLKLGLRMGFRGI